MSESHELPQGAEDLWSWEGHARDQAERLAQLTPTERVEWMDAMLELFSEQIIARRLREAKEYGFQW